MISLNTDLLAHLKKFYLFENINENILETLSTNVSHQILSKGEMLFQQGALSDALYFVIKGQLQASIEKEDGSQAILGEIGANEIVGEMQILVGGKRTANVSAVTETQLIKLPKAAVEKLVEQSPDILQKMANVIIRRLRRSQLLAILSQLFGSCDKIIFAQIEEQIEWVHLHSGEALFRQGEAGDSLYIVISGRLQAVVEDETGNEQIVGEICRGESVGEMAIFAGEDRTASVYARRDCELAKISKLIFEQIMQKRPQMMMAITKIIIQRLQKTIRSSSVQSNLVNIALVPVSPNVRLNDFSQRLVSALATFDTTLHLSSIYIDNLMEMTGAAQFSADNSQSIRLITLLDEQEIKHYFTIYQADASATNWTQWCLKRADQVILVANATDKSELGEIEQTLLSGKHRITTASQILVLLHPNGEQLPCGTQQWLSARQVKNHHHLRWDTDADFERLARFVSGRAIGLVFGGGGARGLSHFGVYLALKEAGIPIDMIGGTSMGALVGAQCAAGWDKETFMKINKTGVAHNPFKEYTLPLISLMGSKRLNALLKMGLGDLQIEDLWTNFFCISSNITISEMLVHRQGRLGEALKASAAAPGISEPVLMDKSLLVDGGILNNLPGDVMRQFCDTVIVVDVGGKTNLTVDYDKIASPWEVLWSRIWPFKQTIRAPSILNVILASTLLSSSQRTQKVKDSADVYLRPPVDKFGLLEVGALEELVEIGYQYTKKEIENSSLTISK